MANTRRELLSQSSILDGRRVSLTALTTALVNGQDAVADAPGGLALASDGSVQVGSFRLTPTGLVVDGQTTEDEWASVGGLLRRLEGSIQWLIGDWFLFAETSWGSTYEAVAAVTGYDERTLRQYAYVARNVPLSVRTDKLAFGHHERVAALPEDEQRAWLQWAAESGASIAALRKALKGSAGDETVSPALPREVARAAQYVQTEAGRVDRMDAQQRQQMAERLMTVIAYYQDLLNRVGGIIDIA